MAELLVDSLQEYEKEGSFNRYDKRHIDGIKSVIDIDKLVEAVEKRIDELKMQREESIVKWEGIPEDVQRECEAIEGKEELARRIQGVNPLIKVTVKR